MSHASSPRAKLLVDLPADRYRLLSPSGRTPRAGDEVVLDQSFTSPDGLPMALAYFPALGAASHYEADVYESELGPDLEQHGDASSAGGGASVPPNTSLERTRER